MEFKLHDKMDFIVRANFYHVAQLLIGSLRISNIRLKSEYPVTKLFKNAQP